MGRCQYPCDEVGFMLEGSVNMIDDDGREETFGPGDAFLMPKGFSGYWKQAGSVTKFFMTAAFD